MTIQSFQRPINFQLKDKIPFPASQDYPGPKGLIGSSEESLFIDDQGAHGMGCIFEDDLPLSQTQEQCSQQSEDTQEASEEISEHSQESTQEFFKEPIQEPHCPSCGAYLDYDAYEDRYICPACKCTLENTNSYKEN